MTVFEQMQHFLEQEEKNLQQNNPQSGNDNSNDKEKKYGIKIEDDNTELLKECGELLQFMMEEAKKEEQQTATGGGQNEDHDTSTFNPSHHDYYKHNPHEYYRHKAMKTHHGDSMIDDITSPHTDIPKIDVIVKMGGAFITNKNELHSLREDMIETAAKQISEAFKSNYMMILIHGAGSYGHFEAKKYKLMNGLYSDESTQGMVLCRAAVSILHQHVLAKLMEFRIPVISVSPNNILTSSDGVISRRQLKPFIAHIKRIIKNGMVPLIHGDIIFDDKRGCHILSGDSILENLCSVFNPQRAVFWSNINGVYDCSNINNKSKLIQSINVNPQGKPQLDVNVMKQLKNPQKYFNQQQDDYMAQLSKKFDERQKSESASKDNNEDNVKDKNENEEKDKDNININIDATGGMWGKVEVASRCCAQGVDVVITKGGSEDAKLALLGKFAENATVFVPSDTLI